MRKIIMWNMVTVDGLFEGPNSDISWFMFDEDLEKYINETQQEADTLIFGRVTFQLMAAYWPSVEGRIADFMNRIEKVVFSRTLDSVGWNNSRIAKGDVKAGLSRLKAGEGGDIFLFGSADFAATLIEHDLIDEYRIGINPLILGTGTPLFKTGAAKLNLKLLETRPLKSGLVILHYGRER